MNKPLTVVCGFGRCGSSLVMQMLAAGGMPTPYSSYPSYEINGNFQTRPEDMYGGAIKILDPHINRQLEANKSFFSYRFIWLDRNPNEQAKSMAKFFKAAMEETAPGCFPDWTDEQIKKTAANFRRDRSRALGVLHGLSRHILKLRFEDILAVPVLMASSLKTFCETVMSLDLLAMADMVKPRAPECLPYLMEYALMAEDGQ